MHDSTNKTENCGISTVSVIIPVYNEEKYIEKCLDCVLAQDYDRSCLEVLFVNGNSLDRTVGIIEKYIKKYPFIKVLTNPRRTVQFGLNAGIHEAKGEYIVRMDAHAEYAADFITKCIETIKKTGAANVGGPVIALGVTPKQKAVAAAYHSVFALGGGKHHDMEYEGYTDTVWCGAFLKSTLQQAGLYDERFTINEDDELTMRLVSSGKKIYITPEIKSYYYPRGSYFALFRQYLRYGIWKVLVIKKHKKPARLSHLVPVSFVLFILIFGAVSFFSGPVAIGYAAVLSLYLILNVVFSLKNKHIKGCFGRIRLIYIHFLLHISYGIGFLIGFFKFFRIKI